MEKQAAPADSKDFFLEIIRALPKMHHPDKLEELSLLALSLLLRRTESQPLRNELAEKIKAVMAAAPPQPTPEAMRNLARGCIRVLREAKKRRLPRAAQEIALSHSHPHSQPHPHPHPHPHHPATDTGSPRLVNRILWGLAGGVVLAVLIGAYIEWKSRSADDYDPKETLKFVEQIIESAQGHPPPTHVFGGALELASMNGVPVVIARGVPPRVCAASGMRLARKGLLSVNGETPQRVSSALITELCYKETGAATIMWAPTK
ncbi:MAG: hypothetical protein HZC25_17385 [Rhodospirillales bacterium]|nr:hypothetical protein [Rhodospirillales bacterium]